MSFPQIQNCTVGIVGLGYVGLPLATSIASAKLHINGDVLNNKVVGFDISSDRISELSSSYDRTSEVTSTLLASLLDSRRISFTCTSNLLKTNDVFIVTVPTPIDSAKRPDLSCLESACETIGSILASRDVGSPSPVVIFESTVYPGVTDDICTPIIETSSGLKCNTDFFIGYSPERINPGEADRSLTSITKVTSGSSPESATVCFILSFFHPIELILHHQQLAKLPKSLRTLNVMCALINEIALVVPGFIFQLMRSY